MPTNNQYYLNNTYIHADRRLSESSSAWVRQFACEDIKPLIICRGPIRKEAMDVFTEMGIEHFGILLSEKDSITYSNALAPELRTLTDPSRVHRVPDYTGASKEERVERIQQIIRIARENDYNSIFTGYGFMAEDEEMVRSMEEAGLNFIGPCSQTVRGAGLKDEAKRTALNVGVSVTPGIDNVTTVTLLKKYSDAKALKALCAEHGFDVEPNDNLERYAEAVLLASYRNAVDLFSIDEMSEVVKEQVAKMYSDYPKNRIRLKAISGGGGKGQRILAAPTSYEGSLDQQIAGACEKVPELVREILAEVKCNGVGDNKNVLVELNIESTRHQEIQVIGNGDWCITMGGRDCSLQMHEQKLLEVSVTQEELAAAIELATQAGKKTEVRSLSRDLDILKKMEDEGALFGAAVGLDSVSTFECIVDGESHFFMEMNTRIQVEHRVTELCYKLRFSNPKDDTEFFEVKSLVEAMVLLARHGKDLPKPTRHIRENCSVEARLNATNQALQPHAGGTIEYWSDNVESEIRDDQGICTKNPDTNVFMSYHLAGAYDSNIALLLTVGDTRQASYQQMAEVLRRTDLRGKDLATNLQFHYGLVNWFLGQNVNARPTTRFIVPYLTAVGKLKQLANNLDIQFGFSSLRKQRLEQQNDQQVEAALKSAIDHKRSVLLRAIDFLFAEPHMLAGWLSVNRNKFCYDDGKIVWLENPIFVLSDLYHYLHMDFEEGKAAAYMIWDHDHVLLKSARDFYQQLSQKTDVEGYVDLQAMLDKNSHADFTAAEWVAIQSAHIGYQSGLELLAILPYLGVKTDFYALKANDDLTLTIPEDLTDATLQDEMAAVLVPPPVAKSDEILAASGGMFYPREAPEMDVYVSKGTHFNEGDPLYIVEVMKMFNKVYAPFSGTVDEVLVEGDGLIIKKGQPLFKITPDVKIVAESPEAVEARRRTNTADFLLVVNLGK